MSHLMSELMNFQRILQCVFYKPFRSRIPNYVDINERLWTGRFGANRASLRFTCRNKFLYLGTIVKL